MIDRILPLLLAAVLAAVACLAGCQSGPGAEPLGTAVTRFLPDDARVPVEQHFHGYARNPAALPERPAPDGRDPDALPLPQSSVFVIENDTEFRRLWEAQCEGPPPVISWARSTVVAVFPTRSEITNVRFHELQRNADKGYTAWFVGDTKPLTTVRYSYPWAIAVLPLSAGTIRVNMVYARQNATEIWEFRHRGTWLLIE